MAISRYTWYNCVKFILYLQWFCTVISPMTLFKGIYFFNNVIMAIYELLIVSRWSICMIRRIKNFRIISAFHVLILIIYYQDYHNDILLMWKEILKPLSVCSEILVYILTSFLWVNITNHKSVRSNFLHPVCMVSAWTCWYCTTFIYFFKFMRLCIDLVFFLVVR